MAEGQFEKIEKESSQEEKIAQAAEKFTKQKLAELNETLSPEEMMEIDLIYKMKMFDREF